MQGAFLKQRAVTVKQYRDLKRSIEKELIEKNTVLTKEKKKLESEGNNSILSQADSIFASAEKIGSTYFINHSFQDLKIDVLKELGDRIKNRSERVFISFVLESEANKAVLLMANKIAVESGLDCNQILKSSMSILNGKGGGKIDMAQGSTSKETSTQEIIETVKKEIIKRVN